jgi:ARG/rhodanese/phosphatase superfamily protein
MSANIRFRKMREGGSMQRTMLMGLGLGVLGFACAAATAGFALRAASSNRVARRGGEDTLVATPNWRLGDGVTYENLTVFPVLSKDSADTRGYETLDEAMSAGDAIVTESGTNTMHRWRENGGGPSPEYYVEGAQVNQLVLVYRGKRPLVLLAGELVSGGKQDRVIGKDRIVPVGAQPLPLDVFCVEHGRWSDSDQFSESKIIVHPSVREKAAVDQAQESVWAAVRSGSTAPAAVAGAAGGSEADAAPPPLSQAAVAGAIATRAPTQSYAQIYDSPTSGVPVAAFADEVQRRFDRATSGLKDERVVGVVVAYGGEVAWSDVFASPELFASYWPKLLRSYVVEALARPATQEHATLDDARQFLQPLVGRETTESDPGVYRWREVSTERYAEISLDALQPTELQLHWLKIHRSN